MRALLNVSMLLALFDTKHLFHATARSWWGLHHGLGWASSPTTQNGTLRVASRGSYPNPIMLADAVDVLRRWTAAPGHVFWPDDLSLLDEAVIDRGSLFGPNQISDVYLLALAAKNGGRLVTMDRRISLKAIGGARPEHLVVVK